MSDITFTCYKCGKQHGWGGLPGQFCNCPPGGRLKDADESIVYVAFDPKKHVVNCIDRRSYFAAAAMQGILAKPIGLPGFQDAATEAVQYADALIKELDGDKG